MHTASLVLVALIGQPAFGSEWARRLELATPNAGVVEVLYLRGEYPQEIRAGFDFATGATYSISTGGYLCRNGDGHTVMYMESDGRLQEWDDPQGVGSRNGAAMIPQIWGWLARRHPEWVRNVTLSGPLITIDVHLPPADNTPPPPAVRVYIDDQGRVTRVHNLSDEAASAKPLLDFDPRSPAGLPLPSVNPQGDRLMSVQWHDQPGDRFTAPRVTALASQFRADVEKHRQLARAARKAAHVGGGGSPDAARPPEPPAEGSEYQWVVFGTGALCVLVGVGVIWWKRRR